MAHDKITGSDSDSQHSPTKEQIINEKGLDLDEDPDAGLSQEERAAIVRPRHSC